MTIGGRVIASEPLRPRFSVLLVAGICLVSVASLNLLTALAMAGILGLILLLLAPAAVLPLLMVLAAMNRLTLAWGSSTIRLEILVVLLLTAVLVSRLAVRTTSLDGLASPLLLPLVLYLGTNVFSTMFFATDRVRGLKLDAEIAASVLTYVVVLSLLRNRSDLSRAMRLLWVITVGEALWGILAFAAYLGGVNLGMLAGAGPGDYGLPVAFGTQWEANIFGSFLLGNFLLLLADYTGGRNSRRYTVGLGVVVLGIAVSMTRTVWLALPLGSVLFLLLAVRLRGSGSGKVLAAVAAAPILALLALILGPTTPFAQRFLNIVNLGTSSASGRLTLFHAALVEWKGHPLFGTGTGSFNFSLGGGPNQPHPWLSNLFLLSLHDTGIIGLAVLLWLIVAFFRTTGRALRPGGDLSLLVAGSIAAFTVLLFAFQTTTGFWFNYPWIVVGIGTVAARLNLENPGGGPGADTEPGEENAVT